MFGQKKEKTKSSSANSPSPLNVLAEGATISGDMSSKTNIRIDGVLEGNLKCDATVLIGKNGLVVGNITTASVWVEGKVDGDILAKNKMYLSASAVVTGGLATDKLIIEDGAMFSAVAMFGKPMPKSSDFKNFDKTINKKESLESQNEEIKSEFLNNNEEEINNDNPNTERESKKGGHKKK